MIDEPMGRVFDGELSITDAIAASVTLISFHQALVVYSQYAMVDE